MICYVHTGSLILLFLIVKKVRIQAIKKGWDKIITFHCTHGYMLVQNDRVYIAEP